MASASSQSLAYTSLEFKVSPVTVCSKVWQTSRPGTYQDYLMIQDMLILEQILFYPCFLVSKGSKGAYLRT